MSYNASVPAYNVSTLPDNRRHMELELDINKIKATPHLNLEVPVAVSTAPVKLDLACGLNCREGFDGVDLYGDVAKHKVDLFKFPWPFADNSVDELHCSHFIEHIPDREIRREDLSSYIQGTLEKNGIATLDGRPTWAVSDEIAFLGQDMFFAFFDECWRILKNKGVMTVICPALRSNRAFQDPTHRRFIPSETFVYLNAGWREANKLTHYRIKACFDGGVNPSALLPEMNLLHPEAAQRRLNECWNIVGDWVANLIAVKG